MNGQPRDLAPIATPAFSALGVGILVLYGISSGPRSYGMMSDEYYYLECARRLAWGYVDHPPFSVAVLALVKSTLGTSLLAVRLVPALLACLNVVLAGLLARELGGGRTAQSLAALGTATAPVFLALFGFYSMNSFEPALWTGAALLLARIANGEGDEDKGAGALWLGLGLLLGIGLLNKISTLWLGLGIGVGLVMTPQRRWLGTPWPWAGVIAAVVVFSPHLFWQVQNGWPTLEFMQNAREVKMISRSPLELLLEMVLVNWLASAPLWLAGLVFFFRSETLRPHRWLAWIWLTVAALLLSSGTVRANYGAPAFTILLAAGGVGVEQFARTGLRTAVTALLVVWMLAVGLGAAPFALPLLPPAELVKYGNAIGITPAQDEKDGSGLLPLHFALRFGWEELAEAVSRAAATLAPGERLRAVVLARNFGDASALNASPRGIPRAVSGHNNYWLWGPGDTDGEVVILVTADPKPYERWYRSIELVTEVDCEYCRPAVDRYRVFVARGLRVTLDEFWRQQKDFD